MPTPSEPSPPHAPKVRSPLLEMLAIAAPVVATMTSFTLMQFVDKLMVSRIGPDPIYVGAQGNGGLASWIPISVMMGFVTIINTFVSQNLGANKPERGAAYAWTGAWMGAAYWLLVLVPLAFFLPSIFAIMRDADLPPEKLGEVLRRDAMAVSYGQILLYFGIFTLVCRAISQYFYGMHRPVVVLVATVLGNLTNLVLNALLIYGPTAPAPTGIGVVDSFLQFTSSLCQAWGIPRLEITGAAIATVIGTFVELAIPLAVFLSPKFNRLYGTARAWKPSLPHAKDLLRVGWAPSLMFGNEMICWGFFMVYLVGHFGPLHSTAGWIAHQWMALSFMPTVGISVAVTAMVGKALGAGTPDVAAHRAWLGVKFAVTYMTFCGVCFVLFKGPLVGMFIDEQTTEADRAIIMALGGKFLIATAAFQFFDGLAMTLMGALKGAGDTKFPSICTVALSWTILVLGGMGIVHFLPTLESLGPWIMAAIYIIALSTVIFLRFLSGKWRDIKLLEHSAGTAHPTPN